MLHKYIYILLLLLLKFQDSLSSVMLLIILACINVIKEITNRFTFCYISSELANFFSIFYHFSGSQPYMFFENKVDDPFYWTLCKFFKSSHRLLPKIETFIQYFYRGVYSEDERTDKIFSNYLSKPFLDTSLCLY